MATDILFHFIEEKVVVRAVCLVAVQAQYISTSCYLWFMPHSEGRIVLTVIFGF